MVEINEEDETSTQIQEGQRQGVVAKDRDERTQDLRRRGAMALCKG